jgi:hypothetical protein
MTTIDLLKMSQAELDALYQRSLAGAVPHGVGRGIAIITPQFRLRQFLAWIVKLIFWQENILDRDQQLLINRVSPLRFKSIQAQIYRGASQLCDGESIILDYSKTSFIFQKIRDEIREVAPGIYLGQAFWGKQRLLSFILVF